MQAKMRVHTLIAASLQLFVLGKPLDSWAVNSPYPWLAQMQEDTKASTLQQATTDAFATPPNTPHKKTEPRPQPKPQPNPMPPTPLPKPKPIVLPPPPPPPSPPPRPPRVPPVKLHTYKVTEFGAIPNDGRDDSAAMRAAASAICRTGGILHYPAGRYNITTYRITGGPNENDVQDIRYDNCDHVILRGYGAIIDVKVISRVRPTITAEPDIRTAMKTG